VKVNHLATPLRGVELKVSNGIPDEDQLKFLAMENWRKLAPKIPFSGTDEKTRSRDDFQLFAQQYVSDWAGKVATERRAARFFLCAAYQNRKKCTNDHKIFQMALKYLYEMAIKYSNMAVKFTNTFNSKALQNVPKWGFLGIL
jgi:hypothetical protein